MNKRTYILKLFIILIIILFIFLLYKLYILNKYKSEKISINANNIFNEAINIDDNIEIDEKQSLKTEGLYLKNYFIDYEENKNNPSLKVKYDDYGEIESFYAISLSKQYIKMLSFDSLKLYSNANQSEYNFNTGKNMKKFLKNKKITNDVEYLKYIKNNYFIKNNVFTSTNTIKNNFLINTFVQVALPEFKNIVLINGRLNGYIMNIKTSNVKEIHLLNNDIQYIITLSGDEITNDKFIIELLKTVKFY